MSKNHRGSGLRELPAHGRGKCAVCQKEGVKVIYEKEIDGNKSQNSIIIAMLTADCIIS